MTGAYVTKNATDVTRHRVRHVMASCSICGSSTVTFSASTPPTTLVFGVREKAAYHHNIGSKNPNQKHHACSGEASSSGVRKRNLHPTSRRRGGLRGSRMWKVLLLSTDGACGDTMAEKGMDARDRLVVSRCGRPSFLDDAAERDVVRERVEATWVCPSEVFRFGDDVSLGEDVAICRPADEPGRDCVGEVMGEDESLARLKL